MRSIFARFDKKRYLQAIFEKVFKNITKNLLIKIRKCIILAYFSKNLTNHAFNFCAFGRKTQIVGKF